MKQQTEPQLAPAAPVQKMALMRVSQNRSFQLGLIALLTAAVFVLSLQAGEGILPVIIGTMAEAYIEVTSFVAATLFLFYGLERLTNFSVEETLTKVTPSVQVAFAAFLGALPGCGGAIIVVTKYTTGRLSFGSMLAVLIATMGDAAFILIATQPSVWLLVATIALCAGTITGLIANAIHTPDFMRPKKMSLKACPPNRHDNGIGGMINNAWLAIFLPGFVFGIFGAFEFNLDAYINSSIWPEPSLTIGAVGATLSVAMFAIPAIMGKAPTKLCNCPVSGFTDMTSRVINDANFVTMFVVLAFMIFEVSIYAFNIDLKAAFSGYHMLAPLIAVGIGFIPGCGAQLLVTSLYLTGAIPLSAQIGNALSNDGDALFPALAIAPKVAIVATLYSAIPALAIGYGWLFLVELA